MRRRAAAPHGERSSTCPCTRCDAVVRRAPSLQRTREGRAPLVSYYGRDAKRARQAQHRLGVAAGLRALHGVDPGASPWSLIICVALLTLWERKVIGWMQLRRGPNRVRIFGLLPGLGQPFADVVKLLIKEVDHPGERQQAPVPAGAR